MSTSIIIVEDELVVANDIRLTLERAGYIVLGIARSYNSAMDLVDTHPPEIVLLDIFLKGERTGIDVAAQLNLKGIPFVYLSANCNTGVLEMAKVTQPSGFIVKPFREKDLLVTLDIAHYRHEAKMQMAKTGLDTNDRRRKNADHKDLSAITEGRQDEGLAGFVGTSAAMLKVFRMVKEVSPLDTSVLILGESGTGKEGIAANIHRLSPRRNKPFVKLNCAALPPNLVESELFGHERGAFTGAIDRRIGKFEQADGGTIFLDEIGEMPVGLQLKLLRVLQEMEIERLGGKETIKVNVRVIAATNRNLEKGIAEGHFRLDLYYRLNVFPVILPPLRQRKEDIPLLAEHFIRIFAAKNNRKTQSLASAALAELMNYGWPGNVRELQNVIERSMLMSSDPVLKEISFLSGVSFEKEFTGAGEVTNIKTIAEMEREHILSVLQQCRGRISGSGGAAELLQLPPSTLKSKMKKFGIEKNYKA